MVCVLLLFVASLGVVTSTMPPHQPEHSNRLRRHLSQGSSSIGADSACQYFTVSKVTADKDSSYAYLNLDTTFYKKIVTKGLVPVTGSNAVSDVALLAAARITTYMLAGRPDIVAVLIANKVHNVVMGRNEKATDVPEHTDLGQSWDWTRGVGATSYRPASSCAEENVMCDTSGDDYQGENILVHEFSHTMTNGLEGSFDLLLTFPKGNDATTIKTVEESNYEAAKANGKWTNTYALANSVEYFAELTQSYFDVNKLGSESGDGVHNSINTRAKLKEYDPKGYSMVESVFKGVNSAWRPGCGCTDSDKKKFPLDLVALRKLVVAQSSGVSGEGGEGGEGQHGTGSSKEDQGEGSGSESVPSSPSSKKGEDLLGEEKSSTGTAMRYSKSLTAVVMFVVVVLWLTF